MNDHEEKRNGMGTSHINDEFLKELLLGSEDNTIGSAAYLRECVCMALIDAGCPGHDVADNAKSIVSYIVGE